MLMKTRTTLLGLALMAGASADTIRLKNGQELEGQVLRTEGDEYVVQVQVTASIRDERRIPKSDVIEVVAERKDEAAFEAIKDLAPAPDLLDTAAYDARITKVRNFLKAHPDSLLVRDAEKILEPLEAERAVVAKGGIKLEGFMIEAEDRDSRAYPLDAQIAAKKVQLAIEAGDTNAALRAWSELERDFTASKAYAETAPLMLDVMRKQLNAIDRSLATLDERVAERKANIAAMPSNERRRTERLIAEQEANFEKLVAEEKEAGIQWTSLSPWHQESLNSTKRSLQQSIGKIENAAASETPDGDQVWVDAWEVVGKASADDRESLQAARDSLNAVRGARLPERYRAKLEERMPAK